MNRIIKKISKIKLDNNEYNSRFEIISDSETDNESIEKNEEDNEMNNYRNDEETEENFYNILSVDVGVKHLGLSLMKIDKEFKNPKIEHIDLIDITDFGHKNKKEENNCKLHHTKTMHDRLEHVFLNNYILFKESHFILIEKQPPVGFTDVEQIIFGKYREKTILISPNSMHAYYCLSKNYDQRKIETVEIASRNITDVNLLKKFLAYERNHDIADSICISLYWINLKIKEHLIS